MGDVGGFQSSIFFIGALIVALFSERVFYTSLIKRIYQMNPGKDDPKSPEPRSPTRIELSRT
jgi:hypothetical protein